MKKGVHMQVEEKDTKRNYWQYPGNYPRSGNHAPDSGSPRNPVMPASGGRCRLSTPSAAILAPSCGSGSPQPTTHAHPILRVNRPPSPRCVGTLPSFRSCMKNPVF